MTGAVKRITSAALRTPGGLVVMLPPPARHHDVIAAMRAANMTREAIAGSCQGFVTSDARFVNREDAFAIASGAGQLTGISFDGRLFSEDLW